MVELSSARVVTHMMMAPAATPGSMAGTTTLRKVRRGGTPRLMEASSTETSICRSRAEVVLTEKGVLRMK